MVHRRSIDGQALVFGNQGALWGNAMTWWDHDTGSIWSQPLGEAIAGPLKGATLDLLPVAFTTWGAWLDANPETLALIAPAGNSGFDLEDFLIVVDFDSETVAYPVTEVQRQTVINDEVAGVPVAIIADPADPQRWVVLSRQLDNEVVELEAVDDELRDVRTGTVWDPVRGLALSGELDGEVLNLLPAITSFPGDYPTFWPDGAIWTP